MKTNNSELKRETEITSIAFQDFLTATNMLLRGISLREVKRGKLDDCWDPFQPYFASFLTFALKKKTKYFLQE